MDATTGLSLRLAENGLGRVTEHLKHKPAVRGCSFAKTILRQIAKNKNDDDDRATHLLYTSTGLYLFRVC